MKRSVPKMKRIAAILYDLVETMKAEGYPLDKQFEIANFANYLEKEAERE